MKTLIISLAFCLVAIWGLAVPPKAGVRANCPYPNGTDTKIHVYNCGDTWPLMVKDAVVYDDKNNTMYPIDPRKPMVLDLISVNNGVAYQDNKVNVSIFDYAADWITGDCKWSEISTFGLLNNIDGCQFAHNCPLQTGDLNLMLPLNLTQFAAIINSLTSGRPYQLQVKMFDYNPGSGHEQIACVISQLKFEEKN
ncbi:hypothetical protein FO519_006002 [Halicephalobus sp. NKZ332]|nr:hypothetical protein FO519_006002 [Halicephalobus sp. NKZ332]